MDASFVGGCQVILIELMVGQSIKPRDFGYLKIEFSWRVPISQASVLCIESKLWVNNKSKQIFCDHLMRPIRKMI